MFFLFLLLNSGQNIDAQFITKVPLRREEILSIYFKNSTSCDIYISSKNTTRHLQKYYNVDCFTGTGSCHQRVSNGQMLSIPWRKYLYVYAFNCDNAQTSNLREEVTIGFTTIKNLLNNSKYLVVYTLLCTLTWFYLYLYCSNFHKNRETVQEGHYIIALIAITWAIHSTFRLIVLIPKEALNDICIITGVIADTTAIIGTLLLLSGPEPIIEGLRRPDLRTFVIVGLSAAFAGISLSWSFDAYYIADFMPFLHPLFSLVILLVLSITLCLARCTFRRARRSASAMGILYETTPQFAREKFVDDAKILISVCAISGLRPLFYAVRQEGVASMLALTIEIIDGVLKAMAVYSFIPRDVPLHKPSANLSDSEPTSLRPWRVEETLPTVPDDIDSLSCSDV